MKLHSSFFSKSHGLMWRRGNNGASNNLCYQDMKMILSYFPARTEIFSNGWFCYLVCNNNGVFFYLQNAMRFTSEVSVLAISKFINPWKLIIPIHRFPMEFVLPFNIHFLSWFLRPLSRRESGHYHRRSIPRGFMFQDRLFLLLCWSLLTH